MADGSNPSVQAAAWVEIAALSDLDRYVGHWQSLADHAIEPNAFYEAWLMQPALQAFASDDASTAVVLVFAMHRSADGDVKAIGFLPLQQQRQFRRWPVKILQAWRHPLLLLTTPLLREGYAVEAWQTLLKWAAEERKRASLIEFPLLAADGPAYRALVDALYSGKVLTYQVEQYTRALLVPDEKGSESYLDRSMSVHARRQHRNKVRGLQKLGKVELRRLEDKADLDQWVDQFIIMEASGWKGREGTAMLDVDVQSRFFRSICARAVELGRLHLVGLFLDDRPVAMIAGVKSGRGLYIVKIAYDNAYRRHSPGAMIQVENVIDVHARGELDWVDSCAAPDHPMYSRIWLERRIVSHLLIAPGGRYGRLVTGLLPLLRVLKRMVTRS